ncbi:MAG: PAS domain-containing sensor histidine kinase [Desulfovibrio sp.]|jgi:two-component system phosphate regulon sensor histidine kinase PhoR|nr:PAS domain-containing sensor histidine kinase [Desulfovibrio sp.]
MTTGRGSLQARLFWAFALITAIALALPAFFSRGIMYEDRLNLAEKQALAQASFAASMLESNLAEGQTQKLFYAARTLSFRMTLTDASGRVLRDSHIDAERLPTLDNHGDRPEIEAAQAKGSGIALRHSNSLGIDAVYAAVALHDGGTLRVAVPLADIRRGFETELSSLSLVIACVAGVCLLLSALIAGWIRKGMDNMAEMVASLARDKNQRRLDEVPGKEFLPLAHAVNYMADNIESYVRDIKDRQSQLETILDSMHEGVLVLGAGGNIRRWNNALAALFPSVATATGRPLIEGLPVPALQRRVDALLDYGNSALEIPAHNEAIHFELPAGRFLVAHISSPVERTDSLGAVIVVYDATEIMRLEAVRRDFVSNVSHELRTPLTAITGYAETLMLLEDLPEEYRNFAGVIHKHASALARIVSDLLALANIENTQEKIALVPTKAESVIADALAACREQAEAKGIRFIITVSDAGTDMAPGLPVLANAPLLAQVFRNLLENACRYSPENGEVSISAHHEGDKVLFTVADSGPGIPQDALPRIFERFYQVKKERNSGTSGIGLALCKHIIERHGGRIWAQSPHADKSTAMLFTLTSAHPAKAEE